MAAGDAGVDRVDLAARHQLGFLHGALDRHHGGLDIDHHALLQTARRMHTEADHLDVRRRPAPRRRSPPPSRCRYPGPTSSRWSDFLGIRYAAPCGAAAAARLGALPANCKTIRVTHIDVIHLTRQLRAACCREPRRSARCAASTLFAPSRTCNPVLSGEAPRHRAHRASGHGRHAAMLELLLQLEITCRHLSPPCRPGRAGGATPRARGRHRQEQLAVSIQQAALAPAGDRGLLRHGHAADVPGQLRRTSALATHGSATSSPACRRRSTSRNPARRRRRATIASTWIAETRWNAPLTTMVSIGRLSKRRVAAIAAAASTASSGHQRRSAPASSRRAG